MNDVGDIFEVLNLDDFFSEDDLDIGFLLLLEGDEEDDDREQEVEIGKRNLDPSLFLNSTYYSFKRRLGNYFVDWCKGRIVPSVGTISTLDPNFFRQEGASLEAWEKGVLKKWEQYGKQFGVRTGANGEERLFNKKHPHLIIPYIDEWSSIVVRAYCGGERHETYKETIARIGEEGWLVGTQMNGIQKPFIEKVISLCSDCHLGQQAHERMVRPFRRYTTRYTMPLAEDEGFLNNLKTQHLVRLMPIH